MSLFGLRFDPIIANNPEAPKMLIASKVVKINSKKVTEFWLTIFGSHGIVDFDKLLTWCVGLVIELRDTF